MSQSYSAFVATTQERDQYWDVEIALDLAWKPA